MRAGNRFVSAAFVLIAARSVNGDKYDKFFYDMLKLHNNYRDLHDSKPLVLNATLSEYAEKVMAMLFKKKKIKRIYVGINMYEFENHDSSLFVLNAGMVFMHWYNELLKYDFTKEPTDFRDTEHFTQIVWKETYAMGVAVGYDGTKTVVVVTYFPRGNIPKQFKNNVSSFF